MGTYRALAEVFLFIVGHLGRLIESFTTRTNVMKRCYGNVNEGLLRVAISMKKRREVLDFGFGFVR